MIGPRRRRTKNLIRIISTRAVDNLEQDPNGSSGAEVLTDVLCKSVEKFNEFPADNYSTAQEDVWASFEAIEVAHSPEAMTPPTEQDCLDQAADLADKISRL